MCPPHQIGKEKRPRQQFGKPRLVKLRIKIAKAFLQFFRRQSVFDLGDERRKQGFGGVVRLMVGFTPEGEVVNVNVLEQTETPGLGTKMADEGNVLLGSVKGQKLEEKKLVDGRLAVKKDGGDVDALTAATISSRAYVDAINRAWMAYKSVATGEAPTDVASGATTAAAEQTNEPAAQEGGQNE